MAVLPLGEYVDRRPYLKHFTAPGGYINHHHGVDNDMAYHPCYLPTMRSFYFQQDKHYKSGFVLDDDNHVVYKLYDEDDAHFWGSTFKDRPTIITRTSDKKSLGSIKFSRGHKTAFNDRIGLFGRKGKKLTGWGNILDSDMAFVLPGGRKYEWCTEDYEVFILVDWCGVKRDMWETHVHETLPQVAELRIRRDEYTQMDFKVRDIRLLEACIVTSLILEDLLKGACSGMSRDKRNNYAWTFMNQVDTDRDEISQSDDQGSEYRTLEHQHPQDKICPYSTAPPSYTRIPEDPDATVSV